MLSNLNFVKEENGVRSRQSSACHGMMNGATKSWPCDNYSGSRSCLIFS